MGGSRFSDNNIGSIFFNPHYYLLFTTRWPMATAASVPSRPINRRKQITSAVAHPELFPIASVALRHAVETSMLLLLLLSHSHVLIYCKIVCDAALQCACINEKNTAVPKTAETFEVTRSA
jgi:hypothetical protein